MQVGRDGRQSIGVPEPVGFALVRSDRLDLGDRAVQHLEPHHVHRLRAVGVADHGLRARVAAVGVDDVEAVDGCFRAVPERVGELLLGAVVGDACPRGLPQARGIVREQSGEVGVDVAREAGAVAGRLRGSRRRCARRECGERNDFRASLSREACAVTADSARAE